MDKIKTLITFSIIILLSLNFISANSDAEEIIKIDSEIKILGWVLLGIFTLIIFIILIFAIILDRIRKKKI